MVEHDGRVIADRYRLTRVIGRGGMGVVWAAVDRRLGHEVAVKELLVNPAMSDDQNTTLLHRALREGRIAAALDHPAVVTVYETFMADDRPWIVMELLRGASLAQLVGRSGPLAPERAAAVGVPVLGALRAAHAAGIIHRDVKPGNVLLADDGRVVLTDFGLAAVEGDPSLTQAGMVMGSPPYVAPERARGAPATPAADLWSLGATLFMAVEGAGPYDRDTPIAALGALVTEEPPAPKNAGPLRPLIEGLLVRDPSRRLDPETAAELLRRVAEHDHSPHAHLTGPAPGTPPDATPAAASGRAGAGAAARPVVPPPSDSGTGRHSSAAAAPPGARASGPSAVQDRAVPTGHPSGPLPTGAQASGPSGEPTAAPVAGEPPARTPRRGMPARLAPSALPARARARTPEAEAPPARGTHAAPEGAPRSVRARGAAWIGRHRAPAKLTAVTTAVALAASVATWNVLRDRETTTAPPAAPATADGPVPTPRPPVEPRHRQQTANPAGAHSASPGNPAHHRRTHRAAASGHPHHTASTPVRTKAAEPSGAPATPYPTLLRERHASDPPRVVTAVPSL